MRVSLIVSPRKACQLHHVAAPKTAETVKRVCLGIDHERRHAVLVAFEHAIGAPGVADFTELAGPGEPICQVYTWDGFLGGVYRLCVGNSPISRGIGGVSWVRVVVRFHLRTYTLSNRLGSFCSPGGGSPEETRPVSVTKGQKTQKPYRAACNNYYVWLHIIPCY